MKFIVFVEGKTEHRALPSFLKRWLDTHLTQKVRISTVPFDGWPDYDNHIANEVRLTFTKKTEKEIIAAIGLLDLYGPDFYPASTTSAAARIAYARKRFERERVKHPKFRQHFAVHELEAWLLKHPGLPAPVINALPASAQQPETVNFNEPPAKLLNRLYESRLKREYDKVGDGTALFSTLDPEIAYNACPNLKIMLDDMLALAKVALKQPVRKGRKR